MTTVLRRRLVLRCEVVLRVEGPRPPELVSGRRHPVRARARDDVHLRPGAFAEARIRHAADHLEFPNGVNRRAHGHRIQLRIEVVRAVEQEGVRILARAVDVERKIAPHRPGRPLCRGRRPHREQRQIEEVAAVERQIRDPVRIEARGERCRRPVHGRRRRNRHGFRHLARLQHHVETQSLVHLKRERLQVFSKSRMRDLELVRARVNRRHDEPAPVVGPHGLACPGGVTRDDHLGAGDNAARPVHDEALQRAADRLGGGSGGRYEDRSCCEDSECRVLHCHDSDDLRRGGL